VCINSVASGIGQILIAIWFCRRADRSPGKFARVCSCHFKGGNRKNPPEIFARNVAKRALLSSPQKDKGPSIYYVDTLGGGGVPNMWRAVCGEGGGVLALSTSTVSFYRNFEKINRCKHFF